MSDFVTLSDPRPGTRVELPAGSQLCLRFRRHLGASRWHVAGRPPHVLPLVEDGYELHFLVFDGTPGTLRLERRHPERGVLHEVCEVSITAVTERTPRSASRRTA